MTLLVAWFAALGFVAIVSAAIAGYGLAASIWLHRPRTALALGVGLYSTAVLVTGLWSGYNVQVQTLLLALGLVSLWTYRSQAKILFSFPDVLKRPTGFDRLWLVLPAVYALTRFFSCGLPQQHSDALYYHLAAPRLWVELGRIRLTAEHPSFGFTGLWEGLSGLPLVWIGTQATEAHIITQLYAQWMHSLWGQLGSVLLGAAILREIAKPFKTRPGLALFVSWLCLTQPAFEWQGCLAKDDYIMILFALAAVLEVLVGRWTLAGLFMGLAYSTKVLAVPAALALVVFIPWRKWPLYVAGALAGVASFLFRNVYWTGNPFFPSLDDKLGPHWLSAGFIEHNFALGGKMKLDPNMIYWIWTQLLHGALPKIIVGAGIVALTIELVRRRKAGELARGRWAAFVGIQLVFALLMLRPAADGRYAVLTAVFAALFAAAAVAREAGRDDALLAFGAVLVFPLGLLINSPIDELWKIPRDYLTRPADHYVEQFHPVYDMQKWVRANVAAGDKILFMAEKQQFYLDRQTEAVVEMKKWEDLLRTIHSPDALFAELRRLGYRYVDFSPQTGGYPVTIRPYWPQIEKLAPKAVFSSPTSLVFDLRSM